MNMFEPETLADQSHAVPGVEHGLLIRRRLLNAALVGSVLIGGTAGAATNENVRLFAAEMVADVQHGIDSARHDLAHLIGAPLFEREDSYHD